MFYDPMISKLLVWAPNRDQAIQRMRRALGETIVRGIKSNTTFLDAILEHPHFVDGHYDTQFIRRELDALLTDTQRDNDVPETLATLCAVIASFEANEALKQQSPSSAATSGGSSSNPWKAFG